VYKRQAYTRGDNNDLTVDQRAAGSVSLALQVGGNGTYPVQGNVATIVQEATATDSYSYVAQQGQNNKATVTLSGQGVTNADPRYTTSEGYGANESAESQVWQIGFNNSATVDQIADRASSVVYQGITRAYGLSEGISNIADIEQLDGGDESTSIAFQGGAGNNVAVRQNSFGGASQIYQDGTNNMASLDQQSGTELTSLIVQTGSANTATTIQSGTNNDATVTQSNMGNISNVNQSGSNNTATVTQSGGSSGL